MRSQRGFTLIELLVVISVIALMSSVVLASVNTARNKAADASVKSNLAGARAEAEIYFSNNSNTYEVETTLNGNRICTRTGYANLIGDSVEAAERAYDNLSLGVSYVDTTASTWDNAQCHESATAWAAWVPLRASANGSPVAFCVDSTGAAKQVTTVLAANVYVCPAS